MSETEKNNLNQENEKLSENPVIDYLKKRYKRKDRATLAHLRSGLRERDSRAMEMYPYLGRFLSNEPKRNYGRESAIFIIAALFAYYPDAKHTSDNLGASMRQLRELRNKETNSNSNDDKKTDGIEKRFVALLNAEAEDLPQYLRQIIGLLKSGEKQIPVNWEQLFDDVRYWSNDNRYVQNRWARSFWGSSANDKKQDTENNLEGETN